LRYITTHDAPASGIRSVGDHSWHARGACHGMDPADADRIFFPTPRAYQAITEAKALCHSCPVRRTCLAAALDTESTTGIWGGLTEAERRRWHTKVHRRLEYARVHAALHGRDVHLSPREREAVVHQAYVRGWPASRLAAVLRVAYDWARDLLHEEHLAAHPEPGASTPEDISEDVEPDRDLENLVLDVRGETLGEAA
jgi:WhiB family transcriptional regulator, redox-sensing transcriptional regulator